MKHAAVLVGVVLLCAAACAAPTNPPLTSTTTTAPMWLAGGCLDSTVGGRLDLRYTGTPNVRGNLRPHSSTDGTCSGPDIYYNTLVRAVEQAAANSLCGTLEGYPLAHRLAPAAFDVPDDAYICDTGSSNAST